MMLRLYTLLVHLALPLVLLRLFWRGLRAPGYRRGWGERFGRIASPPAPGGVWIHAVSVGEVQAISTLVRQLLRSRPDLPITLTTTTPTGAERVQALFGDEVTHCYFPYDLPWIMARFLAAVRPALAVLVETEIWPNLLRGCRQRGIPVMLANGRLSERSARGYQRVGRFAREVFRQLHLVAVQSRSDAERFMRLGLPAERVRVTGSIKFDMRIPASLVEQTDVMRRVFGEGRPVWVAASTHEGEEEQVLEAHSQVLEALPSALLVLVPRHPERFDRVAGLCRRWGLTSLRRSAGEPPGAEIQVLVGDTMGELTLFLGAADAAFIGGSLVEVGGHNMLEASAQGVPVAFGPHVFNFAVIAELLREKGGAVQVADGAELGRVMARWLADASERSRIGEHGRRVVERNRGALERLFHLIQANLPKPSAPPAARPGNTPAV